MIRRSGSSSSASEPLAFGFASTGDFVNRPSIQSTAGYGVLVNATHRHRYDFARRWADRIVIEADRGPLDLYVMAGRSVADLTMAYTQLTGRPILPPRWSLGLWFICRTGANDFEVLSDAVNLRREKIPCDVIGLEPGWMEVNYDYLL